MKRPFGTHPHQRLQLLIRVAYDGADFFGVPVQPHGRTVSDALFRRLTEAFRHPPKGLAWAARTDQGVHALANYATCWFPIGSVDEEDVEQPFLDLMAPREDGLLRVEVRKVGFHTHARALGEGKRYRYRVQPGVPADEVAALADLPRPRPDRPLPRPPPPIWRTWQVPVALDLPAMRLAAAQLSGLHDLRAFGTKPFGDQPTVRRLHAVTVEPAVGPQGQHLVIEVLGEGFLRNMVRIFAGTLAEVGAGLRDPGCVARALASGDREDAGMTAPSRALTLVELLGSLLPEGAEPWAPSPDPADGPLGAEGRDGG